MVQKLNADVSTKLEEHRHMYFLERSDGFTPTEVEQFFEKL